MARRIVALSPGDIPHARVSRAVDAVPSAVPSTLTAQAIFYSVGPASDLQSV